MYGGVFVILFVVGNIAAAQTPNSAWKWTGPYQVGAEAEDWIFKIITTDQCGSYIAAGFTEMGVIEPKHRVPMLFRFDGKTKEIIWKTFYEDNTFDYGSFFDVISLHDGTYLATGYQQHSGTNDFRTITAKVDGETRATINPYPVYQTNSRAFTVIKSGNNFLTFGTKDPNLSSVALVTKFNSNGSIDNTFGTNGKVEISIQGFKTSIRNATELLDNSGGVTGYAVVGTASNASTGLRSAMVTLINTNGTLVSGWPQLISEQSLGQSYVDDLDPIIYCGVNPENSEALGADIVQDGSSIIIDVMFDYKVISPTNACQNPFQGKEQLLDMDLGLVKLDFSGNFIYAKNITRFVGIDYFPDMAIKDGKITILGSNPSNDYLKTQNTLVEVEVNTGTTNWIHKFSSDGDINCPFTILLDCDGGYIIAGNNELNDDDFMIMKLNSNCQNLVNFNENGNRVLSADENWTNNRKIKGKITIPNGRTLTISNSAVIEFASTQQTNDFDVLSQNNPSTILTKLVVEPGGKLIVNDHATLKGLTACGKEWMWEGIEVIGNQNATQSQANQGYVDISGGAVIRDARGGIIVDRQFYNQDGNAYPSGSEGGGIVSCVSSSFINCRKGVWFAPYSISNTSRFLLTNFICNTTMLDSYYTLGDGTKLGVNEHAGMWNTQGIRFEYCTFTNSLNLPLSLKGTGIASADADFKVENSSFSGLYKGVFGQYTAALKRARVNTNTFTGIYEATGIRGGSHHEIIGNHFLDIPAALANFTSPFGLLFEGSTNLTVKGNEFYGSSMSTSSSNFGTIVHNSGQNQSRVYYNNRYRNLSVGCQTQRINSGLQIGCNTYQNLRNAWAINPQSPCVGCFPNQGSSQPGGNTAGNRFEDPACPGGGLPESHILSTVAFSYFSGSNTNELPTCVSTLIQTINSSNSNLCSGDGGGDCPNPPCSTGVLSGMIQTTTSQNERNALRNKLVNSYLDEGDYTAALSNIAPEGGESYYRTLALAQIGQKQYNAAQTTLNLLSTSDIENTTFLVYVSLLIAYQQSGVLTASQVNLLETIAASSESIASSAKSLLSIVKGSTYTWMIEQGGAGSRSKEVKESINPTLKIFPNPTSGDITITFLGEISGWVSIYDITGKEIQQVKLNSQSEWKGNIKHFVEGMYIVKINTNDGNIQSSKLIIRH